MRVIRDRERRDKWQSVWSWMRIGAPYRCHSFVCGRILSRCRRGHGADHFFFRSSWNLRRWHLPGRPRLLVYCVRMWFAMDPWGCFDGRLTSDCPFDFCGPSSISPCPFFLAPVTDSPFYSPPCVNYFRNVDDNRARFRRFIVKLPFLRKRFARS